MELRLTEKQERMLSGEEGEATRKAMEILVGIGDIYDADELIPITSAHISGISITTAGDAGLGFVEDMADKGAEVSVPTTINPVAMDLKDWRSLGAPKEISEKQIRMIDAYREMDVRQSCSCAPYLIGNRPGFGEHVAWAESSAIVYANSVLGARTNREGGPSALASAITGFTPDYGYHLDENRSGTVTVKPDPELLGGEDTFSYSVLGYWIGKEFPESVPVIEGIDPDQDQMKALGAGMATSGAIALYHVPGVTPEAREGPELCQSEEEASFDNDDFGEVVDELDQTDEADLVCIGCPHLSESELEKLSEEASGKETWACMARDLKDRPESEEPLSELEDRGVTPVCDTCMVVAPLSEMGYSSIGVNSAKAAYYAPSLAGVKVHFAPLKELLR